MELIDHPNGMFRLLHFYLSSIGAPHLSEYDSFAYRINSHQNQVQGHNRGQLFVLLRFQHALQ